MQTDSQVKCSINLKVKLKSIIHQIQINITNMNFLGGRKVVEKIQSVVA